MINKAASSKQGAAQEHQIHAQHPQNGKSCEDVHHGCEPPEILEPETGQDAEPGPGRILHTLRGFLPAPFDLPLPLFHGFSPFSCPAPRSSALPAFLSPIRVTTQGIEPCIERQRQTSFETSAFPSCKIDNKNVGYRDERKEENQVDSTAFSIVALQRCEAHFGLWNRLTR